MDKKVSRKGDTPCPNAHEVVSDRKVRSEGMRIKHRLGKMAALARRHRGEFAINGLRNRDLQALLYDSQPASPPQARRRSAAISRKLRMLRAQGILQKLPHTHRYQVTTNGRLVLNAILSAQRTTAQQLTTLAACNLRTRQTK